MPDNCRHSRHDSWPILFNAARINIILCHFIRDISRHAIPRAMRSLPDAISRLRCRLLSRRIGRLDYRQPRWPTRERAFDFEAPEFSLSHFSHDCRCATPAGHFSVFTPAKRLYFASISSLLF